MEEKQFTKVRCIFSIKRPIEYKAIAFLRQ